MPKIIGLEIMSMRKACDQMQPYMRPDCPKCGWPLETSVDDIRHCKFCGWTDQNPIRRDVELV